MWATAGMTATSTEKLPADDKRRCNDEVSLAFRISALTIMNNLW